MQWTVRLEATTSAGEVTTTELVTISRPGVVSTLAEVGLVLDETETLLSNLQASMLYGHLAAYVAITRLHGVRALSDAYAEIVRVQLEALHRRHAAGGPSQDWGCGGQLAIFAFVLWPRVDAWLGC